MSFVDFEPKPQQRPYDSWENPHPQGFIAILKQVLNAPFDMGNWSRAATGAPPSTEEEAFLYNLARDRGIAGAFGAASTFGPAAPQFVRAARGAAGRIIPQALERDAPRHSNGPGTGNMPGPAVLPSPDRFRTNPSGWPSPGSSVPSVLPPVAARGPSGGLLARLRELDAMERQAAAGTGPSAPVRDPNFRQLSRIVVRPLEVASSVVGRNNSAETSDPEAQKLEALPGYPRQNLERSSAYEQRADGSNFPGYGGKGGGPGKGGGGGNGDGRSNDDDDAHPCTQRWIDEVENWCPQFWKAGERWVSACEDRAGDRNSLCWGNGGFPVPGEPDRYAWNDIPRKRIKPYSLRPKK
jgi:hypothetical protein